MIFLEKLQRPSKIVAYELMCLLINNLQSLSKLFASVMNEKLLYDNGRKKTVLISFYGDVSSIPFGARGIS